MSGGGRGRPLGAGGAGLNRIDVNLSRLLPALWHIDPAAGACRGGIVRQKWRREAGAAVRRGWACGTGRAGRVRPAALAAPIKGRRLFDSPHNGYIDDREPVG